MNRTLHPKASEYTFFSSALECSPGQITVSPKEQMSIHSRKLKSFQTFFQSGMKLKNEIQEENWKTHKNMEIKREKISRHSDK